MNASTWRALVALSVALLAAPSAWNDRAYADDPPPAAPPSGEGGAGASSSPVSATGLLPIFGVAVDFDGLPDKA